MQASDEALLEALRAGASAFVPKDSPVEDVIAAARHAFVSPRTFTARNLRQAIRRQSTATSRLSPRERAVLALLRDGAGVAQIAKQLYISESRVKTHIFKLLREVGCVEPRNQGGVGECRRDRFLWSRCRSMCLTRCWMTCVAG
jgi:DNA-binding NarL/FixJ family response regulator